MLPDEVERLEADPNPLATIEAALRLPPNARQGIELGGN